MVKGMVFAPCDEHVASCGSCEFHLKGCCFDPKKSVDGFFAAPCFGCKQNESGL